MAASNPECTSFPQFPQLPPELRMLVWEFSIKPRIVDIRLRHMPECIDIELHETDSGLPLPSEPSTLSWASCHCIDEDDPNKYWNTEIMYAWIHLKDHTTDPITKRDWPYVGFSTSQPIPATLLACYESRQVALKFYSETFSTLGTIAQIPFCFELDTLYIASETWGPHDEYDEWSYLNDQILTFLRSEDLAKVQNLALTEEIIFEDGVDWERYLCNILCRFGHVKSLAIVSSSYRDLEYEGDMSHHQLESQWTLIDAIHMRRRHYMFEHPEYHANHSSTELPDQLRCYKLLRNPSLTNRMCSDTTNEIPLIEYKVLTTLTTKSKLEALQKEFEAQSSCRCYNDESIFWADLPEYQ